MTRYSLDLRKRVVNAYKQDGTTMRSIADTFQISTNTVLSWLKLEREGNLMPPPAKGGRVSQLVGREEELAKMVQKYPDYILVEYCEYWLETTGIDVNHSTMSRWLRQQGWSLKKNFSQSASK
ncbi:MAG: transposase [Limnothrix sp.]